MSKKPRHTRYHWLEDEIITHLIKPKLTVVLQSGTFTSYKEISDAFEAAYPISTVNPGLVKEWITSCGFTLEKQVVVAGLPHPLDNNAPALKSSDEDAFDNEGPGETRGEPGGMKGAMAHVGITQ